MKKKNLKSLKLNKKSISNFKNQSLNGGAAEASDSPTVCQACPVRDLSISCGDKVCILTWTLICW